jgi:hypothetical protein
MNLFIRCATAAALGLFLFVGEVDAYDAPYPFNQYSTYQSNISECGSYFANNLDEGRFKYSCRLTALAHLQPDTTIRKFIGIACARGASDALAQFNARSHADELVDKMKTDDAKVRHADASRNETYINDNTDYHCIATTGMGNDSVSDGADTLPPLPSLDSPASSDQAEKDRQLQQDREEAREREEARRTLVVDVKSLDQFAVHVNFHSKGRNFAWPGGDQVYPLKDSSLHTFRLDCTPKERICYGAGRSGNYDIYWGVGVDGKSGCSDCCMTCGGHYQYTLNGGSADGPSASSGGLNEMLDAATGLANSLSSGGGGGGGRAVPRYSTAPRSTPSQVTGTGTHR